LHPEYGVNKFLSAFTSQHHVSLNTFQYYWCTV